MKANVLKITVYPLQVEFASDLIREVSVFARGLTIEKAEELAKEKNNEVKPDSMFHITYTVETVED